MTSCTECQKMRDDWLNAMIALDVARVAGVTVEAVKHMVAPKAKRKPKEKPEKAE